MQLSTLNGKMNLLSVGTNAKTIKGDDSESLTAILYMAPNTISGYDVCPKATKGCIESCLFTAGRGAMNSVMQARIRKTKLYFEKNLEFITKLTSDLTLFNQYCKDNKIQGYVRLNGTSDIDYSDKGLFEKFTDLKFYDYTKVHTRTVKHKNYNLTYSRGETTTDAEIKKALKNKLNVAVVFAEVPVKWKGHVVEQGDLTDMRWNDTPGTIIGLKAKGLARKDQTGFVVRDNTL